MSVFKRPGAVHYSYDFQLRGTRFHGSTGRTTKPEAQRFEKDLKAQMKAASIDTARPLTFAEASSLYWDEVGQHHRNADDTERTLGWLQKEIGLTTMVAAIDEAMVARLVAKRRGETIQRLVNGELQPVLISSATVNRTVTIPLQAILGRCATIWKQKVQSVDWRKHRLKEARERVREASVDEEEKILDAMREDYRPAVQFAILSGCRRAEIVGLTWQRVDFFTATITVIGKGDKTRTIPMTQAIRDLLWAEKDRHPTAVFTYAAVRTRGGRIKGERHPITIAGFKTAWRRGGRTSVENFRFHDARHTTASRLVRVSGNLRLAQNLLGHEKIETTLKYAHVTNDDLRAAMTAAHAPAEKSPTKSTTTDAVEISMLLRSKGKSD